LNWIDDAENAVNEAAAIERSIIDLKDKKNAVSKLCEQVDGVYSAIKQIDKLIDLQDAVQEAIDLYDAMRSKKKHLDMLTALLDSHSSYSFSISKIQSMVNEHNSIIVDEAVSLHEDMLKLADKKCNIQTLIDSIEEVNNKIANLDVELNNMTQNFEGSMNNYSSCPLCDSIIERALNEGV
jgi:vacuolar-type H+-ATPase catalytic subunit A/Vma1